MHEQTQRERKYRQEQWTYGYRLFEAGQPVTLCTTVDQQRGYHAALNACAYATTSEYLVKTGVTR